ncbi:MAG: hypothetical protein Q4A71_08260 [Actinomycetaceae bacterium]|nr:hypothetical protein [Actinomycetaceae bacterium]
MFMYFLGSAGLSGVEVGAYQHGRPVYDISHQDPQVEETGCLLADRHSDFGASPEGEPDLVCSDNGVVDEGGPLGWLEVLDWLVDQLGVGGFDRGGFGMFGCDLDLGVNGLFAPLSETQINAQRAELQDQLRGAQSNLNDINRALAQISEQRRAQADQLARLQNQIDRDLTPRQYALSRDIKALKEITGIQQRREQIRETITALTAVEKEQEQQRPPFKPLEEFDRDFFYTMNETIRRILIEIGFPGAETIKFDEETLDVTVAVHEKKIEGKGYVSLLKTVVLLAFHEYIDPYSHHTPGFLLIDSPLKNFDDTQLKASESMRRKLLEYIARTNTNRQVILCENSDRLIDIDLDELPNTSVTRFTKNPDEGRYGYLSGVYEPGEQIDD